jgi:hypothetical protein
VTGSLVWAMALHGFWDFSLFIIGASGATNPLALLSLAVGLVAVVLGFIATKDAPSLREADVAVR